MSADTRDAIPMAPKAPSRQKLKFKEKIVGKAQSSDALLKKMKVLVPPCMSRLVGRLTRQCGNTGIAPRALRDGSGDCRSPIPVWRKERPH